MSTSARQTHNIPPLFDDSSRILILGSFPSVKSREGQFFYDHPQNRFWRVLSHILGVPTPATHEEKRDMLLTNHIALWDVIESCDIEGSSDTSIKNVVPNDLSVILDHAPIRHIYTNGGTSDKYFKKYNKDVSVPVTKMPSTSPANAAASLEKLIAAWSIIKDEL